MMERLNASIVVNGWRKKLNPQVGLEPPYKKNLGIYGGRYGQKDSRQRITCFLGLYCHWNRFLSNTLGQGCHG